MSYHIYVNDIESGRCVQDMVWGSASSINTFWVKFFDQRFVVLLKLQEELDSEKEFILEQTSFTSLLNELSWLEEKWATTFRDEVDLLGALKSKSASFRTLVETALRVHGTIEAF